MKLLRREAITILVYSNLLRLTNEKRADILIEIYSDSNGEELDPSDPNYNQEIITFLENNYKGVKNIYLANQIKQYFKCSVLIIGSEEILMECLCCGFRTLDTRGEYDICKVCYWEDDGSSDRNKYSPVNKMTLREAQATFLIHKAISQKLATKLDPDRMEKYLSA